MRNTARPDIGRVRLAYMLEVRPVQEILFLGKWSEMSSEISLNTRMLADKKD